MSNCEHRIAFKDIEKSTVDVSVVAANYNNGLFLDEFFSSCTRSTVRPKEWIFVDDGSTDNSLEVANSYIERLPNLRIVPLQRNEGFANALNAGIRAASGTYIARMDPDDTILENRLALQFDEIRRMGIDILGGKAIYFHNNGRKDIWASNCPTQHDDIIASLKRGDIGVVHASAMIRRSLMLLNPYVQKNVPAEDYDLFSRLLLKRARFGNLSDAVIRVRVHSHSSSNKIAFATVKRTFALHDACFGTQTPRLWVAIRYLHLRLYRRALYAGCTPVRMLWMALAAVLRPSKVWYKLKRSIK